MIIIRTKFTKKDDVKFVSHLEMMKCFQRAVRRAKLRASFSKGFNPQMKMVFGLPLPVGVTSSGEYVDIIFEEDYSPVEVLNRLKDNVPPGFELLDSGVRKIKKNIMADIAYAEYVIHFDSNMECNHIISTYNSMESIVATKKTKKRTREIDIKKYVLNIQEENSSTLKIFVKAGSFGNLHPRLFMQALKEHIDESVNTLSIHRNNVFVDRKGKAADPISQIALEEE